MDMMGELVPPPRQCDKNGEEALGIGSEYPMPPGDGHGDGSLALALKWPGAWSGKIADTPAQIVKLHGWLEEALVRQGVPPGATRRANVGSFFVVEDPMDDERCKAMGQPGRDQERLQAGTYVAKVTKWHLTWSSEALPIAVHILVVLDPRPPVGSTHRDRPKNPIFGVEGKPCHLWISGSVDLIRLMYTYALKLPDDNSATKVDEFSRRAAKVAAEVDAFSQPVVFSTQGGDPSSSDAVPDENLGDGDSDATLTDTEEYENESDEEEPGGLSVLVLVQGAPDGPTAEHEVASIKSSVGTDGLVREAVFENVAQLAQLVRSKVSEAAVDMVHIIMHNNASDTNLVHCAAGFEDLAAPLKCVYWSACNSSVVARHLVHTGKAEVSVGADGNIKASVSRVAVHAFYSAWASGRPPRDCYFLAVAAVRHLDEACLPVQWQRGESWASKVRLSWFGEGVAGLPDYEQKMLEKIKRELRELAAKPVDSVHALQCLTPRDYQMSILKDVRWSFSGGRNACVYLPTGAGKTFLSSLVMDMVADPDKKPVLFIVPTNVLAVQQARELKAMTGWDVQPMCGGFMTLDTCQALLRKNRIVVATSGFVVKREGKEGVCAPWVTSDVLSLVVFDEAHKMRKKSDLMVVMKHLQQQDDRLPVLGLTASPCHLSGDATLDEAMRNLDNLLRNMHADLVGPTKPQLAKLTRTPRPELYEVKSGFPEPAAPQSSSKEVLDAFESYRTEYAELTADPQTGCPAGVLGHALGKLGERGFPAISPSVAKLQEILATLSAKDRVIVFVERRKMVESICSYLRTVPNLSRHTFGSLVGGLSTFGQLETSARFNSGDINVLVATDVVEEGLDVQKCNHVILLKQVQSATKLIQATGRARAAQSCVHVVSDKKGIQRYNDETANAEHANGAIRVHLYSS